MIFVTTGLWAQRETNKWKAQISLGINNPSRSNFEPGYMGQTYNFPTLNLGVQNMFSNQFGAKLDYSFSRMTNEKYSTEFKINYSRINAQLVYDATRSLGFVPNRMGFVLHSGPGFSFVQPLAEFSENKTSFFNAMAGFEFHYGIAERLSLYLDLSYIQSFAKDFQPFYEGFGSFNDNLLTLTFGITFSLSGCQYCSDNE